ncbi:hypothetical protein [Bacillus cereus group sp. BfR-BA-01380]|nr:hypothetical protein [Bacillus cereus group sp. BfR-BA-01380]
MGIDSTFTVPAMVALGTFVLLHLVIEPRKEKEEKRKIQRIICTIIYDN